MPVFGSEAEGPNPYYTEQAVEYAGAVFRLEQATCRLFYAQYHLAMTPCDRQEDIVSLTETEYLERFGEAVCSGAELDQTALQFLEFVGNQRCSRHRAVYQALRERPMVLRLHKAQTLREARHNLRDLRNQAEDKTKAKVREIGVEEQYWSQYELQGYQKNWLATQAVEDARVEIGWEHRILTAVAYPVHSIFSIANVGVKLDRS